MGGGGGVTPGVKGIEVQGSHEKVGTQERYGGSLETL